MRLRFEIGCLILLTYSMVQAQDSGFDKSDKDYRSFKTTLNKETASSNPDTVVSDVISISVHPSRLPAWLRNLPQSSEKVNYAVGISDPEMERDPAFRLAELRAKTVLALMNHPVVSSITDNFAKEKSVVRTDEFTTKYENLYKIESSIEAAARTFEIVDSCFTSFGEAIVLIKHYCTEGVSENTEQIRVSVDAYQVERQKQNKFEMEELLKMKGSAISLVDTSSSDKYSYSCSSLNNLFEIESKFNEKEILFSYLFYRYTMGDDTVNNDFSGKENEKLSYGLWKAYSELITQKIISLSQSFVVNVKQVGDQYSSENKSLSREISEANPSFKLNKLDIHNNFLTVDMDYLNKPK
jgi:hypothetical protein